MRVAIPRPRRSLRAEPSSRRSRSSAVLRTTPSSRSGRTPYRGFALDAPLKDFQKDIVLEQHNEAGQLTSAYRVLRCWVSEFQAIPDLDANANAVAIEHLKLENEGWERDHEAPPY